MTDEERQQVMFVEALGSVYADSQLRLLTTTNVLYYSKAGVYVPVSGTATAHASAHENGGSDEIDVTGLSGLLADDQNPVAHATDHEAGGGDPIQLDDLAAPSDNTDLDASTSAHGLLKKLSNVATEYMDGTGNWSTPTAAAPAVPMAWVSKNAGQAIATGGSGSAISWATEELDTDGIFDVGSPTRLTIQTPGYYVFNGSMQWDAGSGGSFRYIYLRRDGSVTGIGAAGLTPSAASGLANRHGSIVSPPMHMDAGDYVELMAFHDNGSDRNFDQGYLACYAVQLD